MAQKKMVPGNGPKKTVKGKAKPASASAIKIVRAKKPRRVDGSPQTVEQELAQRNAELQIISSVQAALAAELNIQGIYDAVGDKIREIFHQADMSIRIYDPQTRMMHVPYYYENKQRITIESLPLAEQGIVQHVLRTRDTLVIDENVAEAMEQFGASVLPGTQMAKTLVYVPLVVGDQARGIIDLVNMEHEHAFSKSDVRLLETLANSMSVALENARLFDETQRLLKVTEDRAAELAIINSVQAALAAELNIQGIYDAVGDQIRSIFKYADVGIRIFDPIKNLVHFPYAYEKDKRVGSGQTRPMTNTGFSAYVFRTGQTLVVNENMAQAVEKHGSYVLPGTVMEKSAVYVPLVAGDQVRGLISLGDTEREHAFGESDVRLLETLASAMSVALENARLFDEVQKSNAQISDALERETASNDILRVIAESPTDIQPVLDVIAQNARKLCEGNGAAVYTTDGNMVYEAAQSNQTPATLELHSQSYPAPLQRDTSLSARTIIDRTVVHIPNMREDPSLPEITRRYMQSENMNCVLFVPLLRAGEAMGAIGVGKPDPAPFTENQIALLKTFASQAVIAMENVRHFTETQRLLKETEERNAELAVINSVQQALAAELNIQGIYNAVGDKIRELFRHTDMTIRVYDPTTNLIHFPYTYEKGKRIFVESTSLAQVGFGAHVLHTRETLVINEKMREEMAKFGSRNLPGTDYVKSSVFVPLVVGDQARGLINVNDSEREHAFSESDVRLLQTLANSMSVALENARLFDETQRLLKETEDRAAELAIINSVQAALAAELNIQGIYEAVGEKIRAIFKNADVGFRIYDTQTNLLHVPFAYENGQRIKVASYQLPVKGFGRHVLSTGETLVVNENMEQVMEKYGSSIIPGTSMTRSLVLVPLKAGNQVRGTVELSSSKSENAFSQSEVRLLQTLANAMSVALENARLFDETQRLFKAEQERVAELAVINSVQTALASQLDFNGIVDAVGDKLTEIFSGENVGIGFLEKASGILKVPYIFENGKRIENVEFLLGDKGLMAHIAKTLQSLLINTNFDERAEEYGVVRVSGEPSPKSWLGVPIILNGEYIGGFSLQNWKRENAYTDSHVRLLQTLAGSLGVALENARLFKAEQERVAELQIINSIQQGLAAELDFQAIVDLVGDKLREVFKTKDFGIRWYDEKTDLVHFMYEYEHDIRLTIASRPLAQAPSIHLLKETRQPIVANTAELAARTGGSPLPGTDMSKSIIIVPIISGDRLIGSLQMEDYERENAYGESELRLLTTIAASLGTALENARLFDETQRLLKETEERAAELSIINQVQLGLASKLEVHAIYELIGDQLRNMFDSQAIAIVSFDLEKNTRHYEFVLEKGHRMEVPDAAIPPMSRHIIRTKQPLLVNEDFAASLAALGITAQTLPGTEPTKSLLRVPIIASGQVRGVIGLDNIDRENAFTETDVRLLSTLANGMGVALESARLFNEATEARAAADKANATKSTFLSNMSHELRTPLNAIIGFTRIVRRKAEGALPEKQTENLDKILTSAEHLLGLINTVLDIAKIEAGRMDVHAADFDIVATAEQCITLASTLLKPNVRLEKKVDEVLPAMHSDQEKVRQIVLNLLSNAAKFTHDGSVTLAIEKINKDINIHVVDSGIGISQEALERVFEEFQQADATTTRKYGGTGLGLAISRNLARLLGGDLTVTSQLGQGSTFTLTLPIQYQPKTASKPDPEAIIAQSERA